MKMNPSAYEPATYSLRPEHRNFSNPGNFIDSMYFL